MIKLAYNNQNKSRNINTVDRIFSVDEKNNILGTMTEQRIYGIDLSIVLISIQ